MEQEETNPNKSSSECPECGSVNIAMSAETKGVWTVTKHGKCNDCDHSWQP